MITLKGVMLGCDVVITVAHQNSMHEEEPSNLEIETCGIIQHFLHTYLDRTHKCGCPPNYSCKHILKRERTKVHEYFTCDILTSLEEIEKAEDFCKRIKESK